MLQLLPLAIRRKRAVSVQMFRSKLSCRLLRRDRRLINVSIQEKHEHKGSGTDFVLVERGGGGVLESSRLSFTTLHHKEKRAQLSIAPPPR